jgi:hypothetical protein
MSYAGRYEAAFRVKVLDEDGQPVTNATVTAAFWKANASYSGHEIENCVKQTSTNGICEFQGRCDGTVSWGVDGPGYYRSGAPSPQFTNLTVEGRLEPWNSLYEVTLKRIGNPIPMYSRDLSQVWPFMHVPELGKSYGFDLVKSDWIAPFGKGETADFLIRIDTERTVMSKEYLEKNPESAADSIHSALSLTFSNPDDGIQAYYEQPRDGSIYRLPRFAPESGYETNLFREYRIGAGAGRNDEMLREDLNYLFRVRTNGLVMFHYFLNPTPNDRNLEHDPKRNLFQAK